MLSNCIPLSNMPIRNSLNSTVVVNENMDAVNLNQQLKFSLNYTPTASGSCFVELSGTKVLCSVYGPFASQRGGYNDLCQTLCTVKYASFDKSTCADDIVESNNCSSILENAIKPIICLEKYPKAVISIQILVLQVSQTFYF